MDLNNQTEWAKTRKIGWFKYILRVGGLFGFRFFQLTAFIPLQQENAQIVIFSLFLCLITGMIYSATVWHVMESAYLNTITHPQPPSNKERLADNDLTMLQRAFLEAKLKLEIQINQGTDGFFVIVGLSFFTMILALIGSSKTVPGGLGITQWTDNLALLVSNNGNVNTIFMARIIALFANVGVMAVFFLCAYFARKGQLSGFIVGITIYGLDMVLVFVWQQWGGVIIHFVILGFLLYGLKAKFEIDRLETSNSI